MDANPPEEDSLGVFRIIPSEVIISIIAKSRLIDILQLCKVSRDIRSHATHLSTGLKQRLLQLAFYYIDTKLPQLSIAALETAIQLFPTHPEFFKELGCCWMDMSKPLHAVSAFKRGLKVSEGTAYGFILRAQTEWALGNNKEAWKWANEAVNADKLDPRSYHFRAFMQSSIDSDEASKLLEIDDYLYILKHLSSYGRISIIHNNLGYVYYELKEYDKANFHFDESIRLCPHHAQTYYNKAVCLADQENVAEATEYCEAMIAINPKYPDAHSLRGWIHIGQGQVAEGVESYRKALHYQTQQDSYSIIVFTGGLFSLNRFDEAQAFIAANLPQFENDVAKLKNKIQNVHNIHPDPTKAAETLNHWKTKLERLSACLGACYRVQGEIDIALGDFDRVKELHAKFQECLEGQTEAQKKRSDTPLLRHCAALDLSSIRQPVIDVVFKYHELRQKHDLEGSFRALQQHLYKNRFTVTEDEAKYLIACVGHFFLSLYWEGDQYVEMLENFWKLWDTRDRGFLTLSNQPHLLINLFDLATRTMGAAPIQMILQAFAEEGGPRNQLVFALEQLGNLVALYEHGDEPVDDENGFFSSDDEDDRSDGEEVGL